MLPRRGEDVERRELIRLASRRSRSLFSACLSFLSCGKKDKWLAGAVLHTQQNDGLAGQRVRRANWPSPDGSDMQSGCGLSLLRL